MRKIKIIHCLGQLNTGGAETLVMNVFRNINMDKIQFGVLLFDSKEGFYDAEAQRLGINLYYTPNIKSVGVLMYIKCMIDFFVSEDIDIVHSHMDWQGGFIAYAAYRAGIKKIIIHSHADQRMFAKNIVFKSMIKLNKYLIKKHATDLCACSQEAGESLFDDQFFRIISNGIDIKRYLFPDHEVVKKIKKELCIDDDDIILGHIGSFTQNKNQAFLIKLMRNLVCKNKKYKLLLVGQGELKSELEYKVKNWNLDNNIIFAGVRAEIPEMLYLMNMFLFPSIKEGLGMVAIEAQVSKKYCIMSDTIPRETDLGLGIVKYLSLNDETLWIENIEKKVSEKIVVNDLNIMNSKFNIDLTIEQLREVYGV